MVPNFDLQKVRSIEFIVILQIMNLGWAEPRQVALQTRTFAAINQTLTYLIISFNRPADYFIDCASSNSIKHAPMPCQSDLLPSSASGCVHSPGGLAYQTGPQ